MAITPPSDIVLDVAKAADPLRYNAAVRKLAQTPAELQTAGAAFDALLGDAETAAEEAATEAAPAPMVDLSGLRGRLDPFDNLAPAGRGAEPYKKFEAFVLQSFIQSMFPKDAHHVFGDGLAGSYWSSMLAEQIASQVAEGGGIGVAAAISGRHPGKQAEPVAQLQRPHAGRVRDALSALPGYVTALELRFADKIMPAASGNSSQDKDA